MNREGRCDLIGTVTMIVISEHRKISQRCFQAAQDGGDLFWREAAAAKRLHIDKVATVKRKIRLVFCYLIDDGSKPDHIVRMRTSMEIGQKSDPDRPRRARPSGDVKMKLANNVWSSTRNPFENSFIPYLVAVWWTQ